MSESVYYADLLPHAFRGRLADCLAGYLPPLGVSSAH
jgi:hypothetical protein